MKLPGWLQRAIERMGGTVETVDGPLLDGSLSAVVSLPTPADHWLYAEHENVPPVPFRTRPADRVGLVIRRQVDPLALTMTRGEFEARIRAAGQYAVRTATMNGQIKDFDPDALVQNLIVGLLGPDDSVTSAESKSA